MVRPGKMIIDCFGPFWTMPDHARSFFHFPRGIRWVSVSIFEWSFKFKAAGLYWFIDRWFFLENKIGIIWRRGNERKGSEALWHTIAALIFWNFEAAMMTRAHIFQQIISWSFLPRGSWCAIYYSFVMITNMTDLAATLKFMSASSIEIQLKRAIF